MAASDREATEASQNATAPPTDSKPLMGASEEAASNQPVVGGDDAVDMDAQKPEGQTVDVLEDPKEFSFKEVARFSKTHPLALAMQLLQDASFGKVQQKMEAADSRLFCRTARRRGLSGELTAPRPASSWRSSGRNS